MAGELEIIKLIAELGSSGVSLFLIWYINQKDARDNKTMNNHLQHDVESRNKNTDALVDLKKVMDEVLTILLVRNGKKVK